MCKAFNVFNWYTMQANIAWMFIEGLFLHGRVTIAVFNVNQPFKAYYFIGWGLQCDVLKSRRLVPFLTPLSSFPLSSAKRPF